MLKRVFYFLVASMVLIPSAILSQGNNTGSHPQRANRLYQRALESYSQHNFNKALIFAKKAFSVDATFTQAYLLAGDICMETDDQLQAITHYEKAISIQPDFFPKAHFILGNLYYKTGNYEEAFVRFQYYSGFNLSPEESQMLEKRIQSAATARNLKNNPVSYNPINLCYNINSANDEYVNAVSADGQMLIFTVRSPLNKPELQKQFREEFYVSHLENEGWTKAIPMKYLSDNQESEGALALSYDNRTIFFTSCHQPNGYGSCDLYYSSRQSGQWAKPQNLGPVVNSARWDSQPSLSSDGKTLYFASNRSGGFGGSDIWKTVLQENGLWRKPENLGGVINTSGDEMSPYIHADGQCLYFSSKGHPGLGGADLFLSRIQADQSWSKPANLGYPINTLADEINLIVHPDGIRAYISSDLPQGKGGYDVYMFYLHEKIRPLPVSYLKGIIKDASTRQPVAASIELIDLEKGQTTVQSQSDELSGEFIAVLPAGTNYALHVNKQGYLFYSHHFVLDSVAGIFDPVMMDIFLKPIEYGQVVILKNVFFALDSYEIESVSMAELDKLVKFLRDNKEIKMEISGHTDNTGYSDYNMTLSTNRARAVFNYLIGEGIDKNRLSYTGKAEKNPVDTNDTPEGRANNRRTEFKIVN